jgi:ribosomal protein L16 Arg81 hydroxylase
MVDVIVAQIHGSKVWNVWQPSRQRPLVTDTAGRPYRHDDSVVSDETHVGRYELRAGDTLYVPRGFLHEAITTTESSLHLAFGINVHRWYDLLEEAARLAVGALADSVEFRKALPVSRAGNSETNGFDGVAEPLERLRQELSRRIEAGLPEALKNLDSRYVGSRASARPNQLLDLERLPSLSPDDSLILRPRLAFGMTTEAERIRLVFHQKRLSLGTALEAPLEYVASGAPFTVRDIPGLSAAKQLTFARTLIAEGFLTFLPVE